MISNSDEKENEEKRIENGERNLGTLSQVDIENITNLVQGELCSIRQIIETNQALMNHIKLQREESEDCDLNNAMIDTLQNSLLLN